MERSIFLAIVLRWETFRILPSSNLDFGTIEFGWDFWEMQFRLSRSQSKTYVQSLKSSSQVPPFFLTGKNLCLRFLSSEFKKRGKSKNVNKASKKHSPSLSQVTLSIGKPPYEQWSHSWRLLNSLRGELISRMNGRPSTSIRTEDSARPKIFSAPYIVQVVFCKLGT